MDAPRNIVVVGAGAAGLMAALRAAERGRDVLVLEKNKQPGIKILMSGGTRCNLTQNTDNRGIVQAYGPSGKFLHSALAAFSVQSTLDFFHGEGVATKVEDTNKIFPVSNKAADVLAALVDRLRRSGAELALEEPLLDVERIDEGFLLTTPRRTFHTEKLLLTTGGRSYPGSGTTGDGYRLAQKLGHSLVPPRPALTPITTAVPWVASLRGITLPDVAVSLWEGDRKLAGKRGSLLFAHFGLSGPVILDLSRFVSGHSAPATLTLEIDFLPHLRPDDLDRLLREETLAQGKKQLAVVLSGWVPRRLADILLDLVGLPPDRKAAALPKEARQSLVRLLQHARIGVSGTLGFGRAEVTAGGIPLGEVDSRTLGSKLVPGLHFAGEILDLDGPIGGYNFQAAWSTGWLAGSAM